MTDKSKQLYLLAFLVSSTLFGLAMASIYGYKNGPWATALEVALVTGLLFGGLMIGAAYLTDRLLLAPIGFVLGGMMAFVALAMPVGVWQPLASPPEPVASIIADLPFEYWKTFPYIRTTQNHIYAYECTFGHEPCNWKLTASPSATVPVQTGQCGINVLKPPYPVTPILFGTIKQWVQYNFCGGEGGDQNNVALLGDGSLWYWQYSSSVWDEIFAFPGGIGAGTVLGLIGMLVPLKSWWQLRKVRGIPTATHSEAA